MNPLRKYIALTICLLLSSVPMAQTAATATFDVTPSADGTYRVLFRLGDVHTRPVGDSMLAVEADGMVSLAPHAGWPALPQLSRLVTLPRGSQLRLGTVESGRDATVFPAEDAGARIVAPYAGATVKDGAPAAAEPDKAVYGADGWYSAGSPLQVENLGVMGNRQLFRLTVHPVQYLPQGMALKLLTTVDATLTVEHTLLPAPHSPQAAVFLVVAPEDYRETLQPFLRWKRQEGYDVVERYTTSHLRDSVQALVAPLFDPSAPQPAPDYLLLVGDVQQLQAFIGTEAPDELGTHSTDLYYADHTGDLLPDAWCGRWPATDTAQLGAIVRKTLRYEQGRGLDTAQMRRVLLVAGTEQRDPAPITTNGQVNYLGRETKLAHPALDTVCYHNPASAGQRSEILDDIGRGALVVNYTAHCTNAGWSLPNITYNHLSELGETQPTVYVNNCCSSNDFSGTCLGEQLLRKPVGGAVGVIGATNSTLWNEDYYWAVGPKYPFSLMPAYDTARLGAFDYWLGQRGGVETLGQLLAAGNLAVTAFGSPYDRFYWEIYCLLGDPSLRLYSGVPQAATLAVGEVINGATSIAVGGTPGATVTALQGDSLMGVARLDATGHGLMQLRQAVDERPLLLTITGRNLLPRCDTVATLPANARAATLRHVSATDSAVDCTVTNIGTQRLDRLSLVLGQSAADSSAGAWIAPQHLNLDTLMPGQGLMVSLPVNVTATATHWQGTLHLLHDGDSTMAALQVGHSLPATRPTATYRLLAPDSSEARRVEARSRYLLEAAVAGTVDSMHIVVTALPSPATLIDTTTLSPLPAFLLQTPDTLTHLHCTATLHWGTQHDTDDFYLVGGHGQDCFEAGFDSYPWHRGGTADWQVDSSLSHTGRYSLRSGAIDYRQTSDLGLELLLPQADSIGFWLRTSTEARYDKLLFSIDGVEMHDGISGETPWRHYSYALSAGRHSLRWRYVKDESGTGGSDCVWLDDVSLPLALWEAPYGWFGNPATLGIDPVGTPHSPLRVHPNPTSGRLHLDNTTAGTLHLFDPCGHEVYRATLHAAHSVLHLDFLPDGLYFLRFSTATGITTQKLIIQH